MLKFLKNHPNGRVLQEFLKQSKFSEYYIDVKHGFLIWNKIFVWFVVWLTILVFTNNFPQIFKRLHPKHDYTPFYTNRDFMICGWSIMHNNSVHTKGPSINHVDRFLGICDPLPLVSTFTEWGICNKMKWPFGLPRPPQLSTWFMDAP